MIYPLAAAFAFQGTIHSGGGAGAGLTVVKKIVERYGGQIRVESVIGEGATFYFTLSS